VPVRTPSPLPLSLSQSLSGRSLAALGTALGTREGGLRAGTDVHVQLGCTLHASLHTDGVRVGRKSGAVACMSRVRAKADAKLVMYFAHRPHVLLSSLGAALGYM
jgi:hypothetical protein